MIWSWFKKRYTRKMKISQTKIDKILATLNKGEEKPVWIVADGFHAITSIEFPNDDDKPEFNPARGAPLKLFINTKTGEVRPYHLNAVKK